MTVPLPDVPASIPPAPPSPPAVIDNLSVPQPANPNQAGGAGNGAQASPNNHSHPTPASGLAADIAALALGNAAAAGASGKLPDAAHVHPLALTNLSAFLAASFQLVANTPAEITNIALPAGTWLVMGQASLLTSGGAGSATIVLATAAATMAPALGGADIILTAAATTQHGGAFSCIVTPAGLTTFHLNVESSLVNTVEPAGRFSASNVFSGLVAVKIG